MLFSIGHSNRSWDNFVTLLRAHNIHILVDVRMSPRSRAVPHFNKEEFEQHLRKEGIAYLHNPNLGGLRKPDGSSINNGLEDHGLRGYADYMLSREFKKEIGKLLELRGNVAFMCAEAVPTTCHRNLLADYLTAHGYEVLEILDLGEPQVHALSKQAKLQGDKLTYPAAQQTLL